MVGGGRRDGRRRKGGMVRGGREGW